MTGTLSIRYEKPTPLHTSCVWRASSTARRPQDLLRRADVRRRHADGRGPGHLHLDEAEPVHGPFGGTLHAPPELTVHVVPRPPQHWCERWRPSPCIETTAVHPLARGSRVASGTLDAAPVVVAVLPMLAVLVHAVSQIHRAPLYGGDYALLEMGAKSALAASTSGPYSRFGWDHPGPATFYWSAPFYALSGQRPEGLGVAALVSNIAAVAAIVVVARRAAGVVGAWTAVAAGAVPLPRRWCDVARPAVEPSDRSSCPSLRSPSWAPAPSPACDGRSR